jgi:hypothetical protein
LIYDTDLDEVYKGDGSTAGGVIVGGASLADNSVTNAKLADMAQDRIKGRISSGSGDPEDLTAANVRTITETETTTQLNTRDTNNRARANHTGTQLASTISDFDTAVAANSAVAANTVKVTNATHTGDVTGATALTIQNNRVTNAMLEDMPANTLKGNDTGSTADPKDLTRAEVRTLLNVEDGAQVNPATASTPEAEAGTEAALRSFSPALIKAAIDALTPAQGIHFIGGIIGVSGVVHSNAINATATTTIAMASNRWDAMPIIPSKNVSIESIAIEVTTAVASSLARIELYASLSSGAPGVLIDDSADLDCSTTGLKTWTPGSPIALLRGVQYWVAVHTNSTQTLRANAVGAVHPACVIETTGTNRVAACIRATNSFATTPDPAPTGTPTSTSTPFLRFKLL